MTRDASVRTGDHRARAAGLRATSQAALSTSAFGVGPAMAGAVIVVFALVRFVLFSGGVPGAAWSLVAWLLLVAVVGVGIPLVRVRAFQLSGPVSAAFAAGLGLVVGIDVWAVWGYTGVGVFPTATIAVSGVLVAAAAVRPAREIIAATAAIALLLIALMLGGERATPVVLGGEVTIFVIIVVPPIITALTMNAYRSLARGVLDRVLIQSTVHAPAFGTGLLASEQLQSVDREIETLFGRVSSEQVPLPLPPEEASRAEELAIELRSHLVMGRQSTWLHDAVHESDVLNGHVRLHDVGVSAALMDTRQRDGFLAALWFLVQSSDGGDHTADVRIDAPAGADAAAFRVEIQVHGLSQRSVEPSAWVALRSVGAVTDTRTVDGVAFSVECVVRSA